MIFLIAYDRQTQTLLRGVEEFSDSARDEAYRRRLEVELALPREEGRYEVVLLEAPSRDVIERSHARYFFTPRELVRAAKKSADVQGEAVRRAVEVRNGRKRTGE